MIRTHEAGTLRAEHGGTEVVLAGWVARRRDHGGVVFFDVRDSSGVVQVVVREDELAHDLRSEYCVKVTGTVRVRPEGNENAEIPTGAVEIAASEIEVLSESAPLPFPIEDRVDVSEDIRLRYRYLDMRRDSIAHALKVRSEATYIAHEVMRSHRFVYLETPDLTRSTPEGARDFLVPVRLQPGTWYALPQSPQLFKQLSMVGGLERYYQLARCFRDEDLRADRQPEFTQIDLEMSFVSQDDVMEVAEDVVARMWRDIRGYEVPRPIPRMTYADAMDRFGSDRPDLRFGVELTEMTEYFANTPFRVFQAPYVGAVVMPGGGSIRIHRRDVQARVFEAIGLSKAEAETKFGFLLEAFQYGPPPHGGIAFGFDRLCALLSGAPTIREVIAFPKTASGGDPLTGAPTPITTAQRREAGVDAKPKE